VKVAAFKSIRRIKAMKKFIATLMMMAMMAVALPLTANAQIGNKRYYRNRTNTTHVYQKPSVYRRHRNLINIGIGTGAGALLGALIGGKKGALIGSAVGAGGSALYTYKVKPKTRRYYRR
jgi:outer membrane lipoprotein SlyB